MERESKSSPTMFTGTLVGRIGKKTFESVGENGKTIGLAVAHDVFRNINGQTKKQTSWVDVIVFPSLANKLDEYLTVGRLIVVNGEVWNKQNTYQKKETIVSPTDGKKLIVPFTINTNQTEIRANMIRLMPDGKGPNAEKPIEVVEGAGEPTPGVEVVNETPPQTTSNTIQIEASTSSLSMPVGTGISDDTPF